MCEINCDHYAYQDQHHYTVLGGKRSGTDDQSYIPHHVHGHWEQMLLYVMLLSVLLFSCM